MAAHDLSMPLGGLKACRQRRNLPVSSEYFYPHRAQGTYAEPHKPSTKWHTVQHRLCGTVARGSNGPKKQDHIRTVKPGLAVKTDLATIKLSIIPFVFVQNYLLLLEDVKLTS